MNVGTQKVSVNLKGKYSFFLSKLQDFCRTVCVCVYVTSDLSLIAFRFTEDVKSFNQVNHFATLEMFPFISISMDRICV